MFKEEFKYYKSRCSPPLLDNVLDFSLLSEKTLEKVSRRKPGTVETKSLSKHHMINVEDWKIYDFKDIPGLIFIVNPFTNQGQQYWVDKCLTEYTRKPNKLNLDPFGDLKPGENWWEKVNKTAERDDKLMKKLRWATLGYHHNWDTKEYSEADRSEFPPELAELSRVVVEAVGDPTHNTYRAEAAIINFYHLDSTLSGHKDVSEPNMESPLLSISFGQSAIFLVGGETTDDPVTAMFLHSGDIVVMSGRSRGAYHGVPRVTPAPRRPWDGTGWDPRCSEYLETNRINLNIRQVLLPGQQRINR